MDHVNYITRDVFGVHFRMIHEIWSDVVHDAPWIPKFDDRPLVYYFELN